jgi:hypothetical protein
MSVDTFTEPPPPPAPSRPLRNLLLLLGGTAAVLAAAGGVAWALHGSPTGAAPAAVIPADAQVYAAVDLSAAPDFNRLVEAFRQADSASLGQALGLDAGQVAGTLRDVEGTDGCVRDALHIDLAHLPDWLGRQAAVALFGMEIDSSTGDFSSPSALAVLSVSDHAAAAAYLQEATAAIESCISASFDSETYDGATVYRASPPDGPPLAIALTDGHLLVGIGTGMVERSLDLAPGEALADDADFSAVLGALPADRALTGYLSMDLPRQVAGQAGDLLAQTGQAPGMNLATILAGIKGLGFAGALDQAGVRFDLVTVGEAGTATTLSAGTLPSLLPADAIGFVGTGPFDVAAAWNSVRDLLDQAATGQGPLGFGGNLNLLGGALGLSIEDDLIGNLTGEMGIAVLPSTEGSLAQRTGVDLGLIAVLEARDPAAMTRTIRLLGRGLSRAVAVPVEPRPFSGGLLYAVTDDTGDLAVFGMAGDHVVVATGADAAAALLSEEPRLSDSAAYGQAVAGLPDGSTTILYLDVTGLLAALGPEATQAGALAPLRTVTVGAARRGEVSRLTVYARVDY